LRISEVYLSIQGEGPRVGEPTIFVRFAGCNLKCAAWPCDSQFAIDPQYREEWQQKTPTEIHNMILDAGAGVSLVNICLTGGEPFLQNKDELKELVELLDATDGIGTIECFSNGTLQYPVWAFVHISFVMDWKLPGSGELSIVDNRLTNFSFFTEKDAVKFTIADEQDLKFAVELYKKYFEGDSVDTPDTFDQPQVFYGAVWGKIENQELVEKVLELGLPWRFTMQVHNYIWDRTKRGI